MELAGLADLGTRFDSGTLSGLDDEALVDRFVAKGDQAAFPGVAIIPRLLETPSANMAVLAPETSRSYRSYWYVNVFWPSLTLSMALSNSARVAWLRARVNSCESA